MSNVEMVMTASEWQENRDAQRRLAYAEPALYDPLVHRQATIRALMKYGDITHASLTCAEMATRIGLTEKELTAFLDGTASQFVNGQVARFLSVPINGWTGGK